MEHIGPIISRIMEKLRKDQNERRLKKIILLLPSRFDFFFIYHHGLTRLVNILGLRGAQMAGKIEILEFRMVNQGNLKAFIDIRVGQTIMRDFRVINVEGQRPWVAFPQTSWKNGNGEIMYKSILTFPKELKELIDSMILAHYQREMGATINGPF